MAHGGSHEGCRGTVGDVYVYVVAHRIAFFGEDHYSVLRGATTPMVVRAFGVFLDQHTDRFAQKLLGAVMAVFLLFGNDFVEASLFNDVGDIVFHFPFGQGAGSLGIGKHESKVVFHIVHECQGVLMIFFRFGGESGNHVLGNGTVGDNAPDVVNQGKVFLPGMEAVHFFQNSIAARLHRQVDVFADVVVCGHGVQYIGGHVLGVGGGKPKPHFWVRRSHHAQELSKVNGGFLLQGTGFVKVFL